MHRDAARAALAVAGECSLLRLRGRRNDLHWTQRFVADARDPAPSLLLQRRRLKLASQRRTGRAEDGDRARRTAPASLSRTTTKRTELIKIITGITAAVTTATSRASSSMLTPLAFVPAQPPTRERVTLERRLVSFVLFFDLLCCVWRRWKERFCADRADGGAE